MIMGKAAKVVICGTKQSGKTSIVEQAIYGKLGPFEETIEDVYEASIETDRGTVESIRIYDTEGIDYNNSQSCVQDQLPKHLLTTADGVVIVYAVDDEKSFQVAEAIRKEVDKVVKDLKKATVSASSKDSKGGGFVTLVLGNKAELPAAQRKVDNVQALNWAAREKVKLFEVSSLDRTSLTEPFVYLSSKLAPPSNKSTFSQLTIGRNKSAKD